MTEGDYRLLRVDGPDTLGRFAAAHSVDVGDLWLPLASLLSGRAGAAAPVPIAPHTAVALRDGAAGRWLVRRGDILARLAGPGTQPGALPGTEPGALPGTEPGALPGALPGTQPGTQPGALPGTEPGAQPGAGAVPGALPGAGAVPGAFAVPGALPGALAVPPGAVPDGCVLFVRATRRMGKRRLQRGAELLHRPISAARAVAEGSALREEAPGARRDRGSEETALSAIPGSAGPERRVKRARSDAVLEKYLCEAMKRHNSGRSGVMIAETMANITRVRGAPPLHFVTQGKAQSSLRVGGLSWHIPDERVLYRVFRRGRENDGGKTTYGDAARLIAVFLIDNVLIQRTTANPDGHVAWTMADKSLFAAARALSERGYRVVLLDHYPSLHHGNAVVLDAKLLPIAELCQKHFECDTTVVVSTMSIISAAYRRDGMSFVFPYSGLWHFFITQLNGGIRPDNHSLLVGAASPSNDSELCNMSTQHHRDLQLSSNSGLRFLDAEQIKRETMIT